MSTLGAMIRLGYLDFDLVFEVVTFPDQFWNESEELRQFMADNWSGPDQPLSDLWSNFAYLRERYHEERARIAAAKAPPARSAKSEGYPARSALRKLMIPEAIALAS